MKSASFPRAATSSTSRRRLLLTAFAFVCSVLLGVGAGPVARPAYADEPADDTPVTEITLQTPGTPEPDGDPITLDTSVWTTQPGVAKPAIVLAHGFGGHQGRRGSHRAPAGP